MRAKKVVDGMELAVVAPDFGIELSAYRQMDLAGKLEAWTPGYGVLEQGRGSRTERWEDVAYLMAEKFGAKFEVPVINWSQVEGDVGMIRSDVTTIHIYEKGKARYAQNVRMVLDRTAIKYSATKVETIWDYKLFVYKNGMPKQEAEPVLLEHTLGNFKRALKGFKVK